MQKQVFFQDAAQIMYDVFICNTTKLRNIVHSLGVFAVFWVATFCVFVYLALSSCSGTKINLLFGSRDESKKKAMTRNRCNQNQKEKEYKTRRRQAKTKIKKHLSGVVKKYRPGENVNIFGTALMDFFSNLPILGFNAYVIVF